MEDFELKQILVGTGRAGTGGEGRAQPWAQSRSPVPRLLPGAPPGAGALGCTSGASGARGGGRSGN